MWGIGPKNMRVRRSSDTDGANADTPRRMTPKDSCAPRAARTRPPKKVNTASLTAGLRPWLALECLLVFFIAPLALDPLRHVLAFGVVPLVLILALITGLLLIRDRDFNRTILWSTRGLPQALRRIMHAFLLPATLLTVAAFFLREAHFLAFPRSRPTI